LVEALSTRLNGRWAVGGTRLPATVRRAIVPFSSLLVGVATWQVVSFAAATGTDQSWRVALHLTWTRNIHFGSGFVWTYGPLGFLSFPIAVAGSTLVASFVFSAAAWLLLSYLVVRRGAAAFGLVIGVPLAYLVVGLPVSLPDTLLLVEVLLAAVALEFAPSWFPVLGGMVAGLSLLTKTNSGAAAVGIAIVASAALGARRAAVAATATVVTFVAGWTIAGDSLGDIPSWLRLSTSIVEGYSPTMQTEAAGSGHDYRFAALATAAFLATAALAGSGLWCRRRIAQVLIAIGFAFMAFKEGFVRHDPPHGAAFFAAVGVATVAFARRDLSRVAALVGVAFCVWGVHQSVGLGYAPAASTRAAGRELADVVVSRRRHAAVRDSGAAERHTYEVPPRLLGLLRGKTVHVDPFETAAIAAYGLRWRPLPVVQAYSAYTSTLDEHNAAFLGSRTAPQRVLRENSNLLINGRSRELEAPAEFRALICNYVQLGWSKKWQVLGHVPRRCGAERVLGIVSASSGAAIPVPNAAPNELVFARVHLDDPPANRVRSLLYKPHVPHISLGGGPFVPLVASTAPDGIVLHVPGSSGFAPESGGAIDWSTIAIGTLRGRARIEFIATPIRGAGPPAAGELTTQPLPAIALTDNGLATATRLIPVVPNTGFIDFAYPRRDALVLRGWVGDSTTGIPARLILVYADGRLVFAGRPNTRRPDVAQALGEPRLVRAGYTIVLPLRELMTNGERRHLRVFWIAGSRAFEVSYAPSFGWR
jgi:hypothetical protein